MRIPVLAMTVCCLPVPVSFHASKEADKYAEGRGYERRDRSASPRGDRDDREERPRDRSPNGRAP